MKFLVMIMTLAMTAGCATVDPLSATPSIQPTGTDEEGLRESWQNALLEAVQFTQ
ncbi:MAG TPA: hypothetical protein VE954_36265 [Oligoflexus sp.]|uniref:hypothetical protein n=1 Tax=Oligoflexus sp. TaxID=1971216 RepID=UPI002D65F1D4|nr:hypothetical protein [Oligoflexus sp.]HYX38590.1 hypothetical protein [Oligoflexus sp.]